MTTIVTTAKGGRMKYIEGDDETRAKKCMADIQALLDRYDCTLFPITTIIGDHIKAGVQITPKNRLQKPDRAKVVTLG